MALDVGPLEASEETVWCLEDPLFSIFGEDVIERSHELAAQGPVVRFPEGGIVIAGPAAVDYVLHNPQEFSSNPDAVFMGSEEGLIPIQKDPPEHNRYRRILDPLFSPRQVAQLEAPVTDLTNRCIDAFIETGSCDVVADLGSPVPSGTILAMLGFPLERLPEFLRIKNDLLHRDMESEIPPEKQVAEAGARAYDFFGPVLEERAREPQSDLATHLVELESQGELTRQQSMDVCLMLLIAGLDTVTASAANMFYVLSQHPKLRERIVRDLSVIPMAVEELLRIIAPVPWSPRVAMADAVVEGCPIKNGERVAVMLPASNWSAEFYENPADIEFGRSKASRHASFGIGKHRCLGSHLARMELHVILREWHRRIPEYSMKPGYEVKWRRGIRDIPSLPIDFPPQRRTNG